MRMKEKKWLTQSSVYTAVFSGSIVVSRILPFQPNSSLRLCPWYHLFDITCPFCGMTRGFIAISHGEIAEAISLNPTSPLIYGTFLIMGAKGLYELAFPSSTKKKFPKPFVASWYLVSISMFAWLFLTRMVLN
jgi:hypothetical protein